MAPFAPAAVADIIDTAAELARRQRVTKTGVKHVGKDANRARVGFAFS
jgi:hypothetical protein